LDFSKTKEESLSSELAKARAELSGVKEIMKQNKIQKEEVTLIMMMTTMMIVFADSCSSSHQW
jgi:hypothetical protein